MARLDSEQLMSPSDELKTLRIDAFLRGMNTSVDSSEIDDNEAELIENMEYDKNNNLVTRNGVTSSGPNYSNKLSSIFSFSTDSGFVGILYTQANQLLSRPLVLGSVTNLTGALTLPTDVRWYWKALNNVAVGVNGSTGAGNPIQVVGPAPGTASHLSAAPDGKYIEEWNSRLFIVHAANPNRIQCSDIGTATVWNTDGLLNPAHGITLDVAPGDTDVITGLYSTKERLFIFKRKKIYVLRASALPITDPANWEVVEYSKHIGCLAQSTIREAFDDVLFLTEGGVASLIGAETTADFELAIVSHKIKAIKDIKKNIGELDIFAFSFNDVSQYHLCVSSTFSPLGKNTTFVLDYSQVRANLARWVQFDGFAYGTSIEQYNQGTDQITYLIGCDHPTTTDFFMGLYVPSAQQKVFSDGSLAIRQEIITKSYDFNLPDIRKEMMEWFLILKMLSESLSLSLSYKFNNKEIVIGSYSFGLSASLGASLWDVVNWDQFNWDVGSEALFRRIRKAFLYDRERKATNVKFSILSAQPGQGYSMNKFGIKYDVLSEYRAFDI